MDFSRGSLIVLYLARIFWGVCTCCVRLSILCLYYRLLRRLGARKHHFWILHFVTAITVLFLIDMIVGGAIPCLPVRAYWDYSEMILKGEKFYCINDYRGMQFAAVFNTVCEIVIAVLPAIAVFRFKVDPKQRWSVIGLLSLGYLVAIAGTLRSYYLWKAAETYDLTWWASPQWCCAEVEVDLAITCACAAPLRPPITRLIRRLKGIPEIVSSIGGRRTPHGKDDRSILSTTALSGQHDMDKFEGVAVIAEEDRNAWVRQMSRTIDLEGIAVDGFGYTVTIQGPEQPPRRKLSRYVKNTVGALGSTTPSRRNTVKDKDRTNVGREQIELGQPRQSNVECSARESHEEISRVNSEEHASKWNHTRSSSKQGSSRASDLNGPSSKNWTFFDAASSYNLK
ncbi:hypothetical protein, variant [Verruconis gallopava]|nr:hypothetical protein, variant [Verruconis gallopava]KIW07039.1 hypothetical protein, variant [Verruconis gallopava]